MLLILGFALNLVGLLGGALWLAPTDDAVEAAAHDVAVQSGTERVLRVLDRWDVSVSERSRAGDLKVEARQLVEIARALS